jgi:hypothetical protein
MTDLREHLAYAWQTDVADAYHSGRLGNRATLLAELYRLLQGTGYPPCQAWLTPDLHFPPTEGVIFDQLNTFQVKQWLTHQQLSLLLTAEDQVVAAIELDYRPDDFVDYRPGIRRLISLHQLAGRSQLRLRLDPQQGNIDAQHAFDLSPELLCVYAIIAKKDAMALQESALRNSYPKEAFPPHFLHLTGAVRHQGTLFAAR